SRVISGFLALQRLDQLLVGDERAAAGIVAVYEPRELAAQIGVKTEVVKRAEIALLDRAALLGAERIAVEHGLLVALKLLAQLLVPFQVLDQVMSRQARIEALESHYILTQ